MAIAAVVVINIYIYDIRPGNSMEECSNGCKDIKQPDPRCQFCDCIYKLGKPLDSCLKEFKLAKKMEKRATVK